MKRLSVFGVPGLLGILALAACSGDSMGPGGTVTDPVDSLAIVVHRVTGTSGNALVSNGVPLPQGQLMVAGIDSIRVAFSGTEIPVYLEALDGRWPDGSLKSLLVQFEVSLTTTDLTDGVVGFGASRSTQDRSRVSPPRMPEAIALPVLP